MNLQKACDVLEELSEREANVNEGNLSFQEFQAIQRILLELQSDGKYEPTK